MKKLMLILIILSVKLFAEYEFPTQFYPTKAHPRIWITDERMNAFIYSKNNNTPEWQRFIQEVKNTYMNRQNESWVTWYSYTEGVGYLSLAYLVTKDTSYANRALEFALKADTSHAMEERYWIRNNTYLALGYDWLYSYMSADQKTKYQKILVAFADNMWKRANYNGSDLTYTSIDSDRDAVGAATYLLTGCALYGENNRAVSMLNRFWWIWNRGVGLLNSSSNTTTASPLKRWIRDAVGGVYYTGLAYYMNTDTKGLSNIWSTLRTACNYDIYQYEPDLKPFWRNMIRSMIDMTEPKMQKLYNSGDWQDPNLISSQKWFYKFITMTSWEAENAGDIYWASLAKGYAAKITSWHSDPFTEFLFSLPLRDAVDPYLQNLPPVRTSKGLDFMFYRDSWLNNANYAVFSGQGGEPTDHQSEDSGGLTLMKNGEYVTNTPRGYRDFNDASFVHNLLSIQNGSKNGGPRVRGDFEKKAALDRHRENNQQPYFGYAMMQGDGQWNLDPKRYSDDTLRDRPVKTYRRHFFISGDYVFVFDRLRAKKKVNTSFRLRALSSVPQVSGDVITQAGETGNTKLITKTVIPQNCTYELVDEKAAWSKYYHYQIDTTERKYHYLIKPQITDTLNMLNIMQMGNSSLTAMSNVFNMCNTNSSGAKIGNWVVLFATQEKLRDNVEYLVQAYSGKIDNLIADLKAGNYTLYVNGVNTGTVAVKDSDNTAYFRLEASNIQQTVKLVYGIVPNEHTKINIKDFNIMNVYPNPFNPETTVNFSLNNTGKAEIKLFDIMGREVAKLFSDNVAAGQSLSVRINASSMPSGIYFVRLNSEKFSKTQKIMLLK